jgi:hypothetical protein
MKSDDDRDAVDLPPVPAFDVAKVLKYRDKLADFMFVGDYVGNRNTGERFDGLVSGLVRHMPAGVRRQAVSGSMVHLVGQPLESSAAIELAWRLAGNVPLLREGRVVLPATWKAEAHWAAVQIMNVRPFVQNYQEREKRSRGALITFQVLTGPAVGVTFRKFWRLEMCKFFARHAGFSAPWHKRPYTDEREITYFRLAAWFDPELIRDDRPGFRHMRVKSNMMSWNIALIKRRRRDGFDCPRAYARDVLCHTCPAGQDECEAATHSLSYTVGICTRCGQRSWFDTDNGAPHPHVCVPCGSMIDLGIIRRHT